MCVPAWYQQRVYVIVRVAEFESVHSCLQLTPSHTHARSSICFPSLPPTLQPRRTHICSARYRETPLGGQGNALKVLLTVLFSFQISKFPQGLLVKIMFYPVPGIVFFKLKIWKFEEKNAQGFKWGKYIPKKTDDTLQHRPHKAARVAG